MLPSVKIDIREADMPELSELIPWDSVGWDNVAPEWASGTGHFDRRPYYFRILSVGEEPRLLLISAVPSRTEAGSLHATDYLRLDRHAFRRLIEVGKAIEKRVRRDAKTHPNLFAGLAPRKKQVSITEEQR